MLCNASIFKCVYSTGKNQTKKTHFCVRCAIYVWNMWIIWNEKKWHQKELFLHIPKPKIISSRHTHFYIFQQFDFECICTYKNSCELEYAKRGKKCVSNLCIKIYLVRRIFIQTEIMTESVFDLSIKHNVQCTFTCCYGIYM